jgi:acyl transferase domain-containing protein
MKNTKGTGLTGLELAVIGMAGRFPGARNLREFQENLERGMESISFLSDRELAEAGLAPELIANPAYVKTAGGVLAEKELFDAAFFDYTPAEAEIMDPQIRVLHECAWAALEDAGCSPQYYDGLIGLYAGATFDLNWQALSVFSGKSEEMGHFTAGQLNNKDFLCTSISYRLNLKGPAVLVQTACSTSLAAIHLAGRALLTGDCDIALAGGVTIASHRQNGYFYQDSMVMSPDGHCRAFDTQARGMVGGNGAGIVVLKPLKKALADGDHIYAMIKGSAINNDGTRKVGYTAPSIKGQVEVIRAAHAFSQVAPESISYVETHGTGTPLGDPVEIEALTRAFNLDKKGICRIGSVKTNIGHLDSAAGVAGFIKTVLALKHRVIPPSLHFDTPNPKIAFDNTPFVVNRELVEWNRNGYPLRAGVSSFGIGGTNVHVVLEEAPQPDIDHGSLAGGEKSSAQEYQLILLSARTPSALDNITQNLVEYFKEELFAPSRQGNPAHPGLTLANAAYTLQTGRTCFNHRKKLVCRTLEEAVEALSSPDSRNVYSHYADDDEKKRIVFMFSGQGSQYVNMGLELYQNEPPFRQEIDRCFNLLPLEIAADIRNALFPGHHHLEAAAGRLTTQDISQPLCFIFSYALAQLLIHWGIQPQVMTGYSIGEYAAACLAGIFSLEDALGLVVLRGQLMQKLPPGVMLSVPLPEEDLTPLLNDRLSVAVVNGPSCIVSGTEADIAAFEEQLKEKKYFCLRLKISHAGHSPVMDSMAGEFAAKVKSIPLHSPQIPIISGMTGKWLSDKEAADPRYWERHLRQPVRFAAGIDVLVKKNHYLYIEVGAGRDLSAVVRRQSRKNTEPPVINLIRHPQNPISDIYYLWGKLGDLWLYGVDIDWKRFRSREKSARIPLPSYPFERKRYWLEVPPGAEAAGRLPAALSPAKTPNIDEWFYIPSWKRLRPLSSQKKSPPTDSTWLVFSPGNPLGSLLVKRLRQNRQTVVLVKTGTTFHRENSDLYHLNPRDDNQYHTLFQQLRQDGKLPGQILHLWGVTEFTPHNLDLPGVESTQNLGFYSLLNLARAIAQLGIKSDIRIQVITNNMQETAGETELHPEKSTVLGAVKVIPREYANIRCRSIDILLPTPGSEAEQWLIDNLIREFGDTGAEPEIAYRQNHRWGSSWPKKSGPG